MADTGKVHFDLDTVERDETFEPFAVTIKGRRIVISDPADIDYQDLLTVQQPLEFFKFTMSQEDRDYLREQHFPGWRLGKLFEAYLDHYKAEERIDQRKKLGF